MLRFDKAIAFSPILKSNLLVSFNIKTCGSDVLLFSELINIVSSFYTLWNGFDYVIVYLFNDML